MVVALRCDVRQALASLPNHGWVHDPMAQPFISLVAEDTAY